MTAGKATTAGLTRWQLLHEMGFPAQWRLRRQPAVRRADGTTTPSRPVTATAGLPTAGGEERAEGRIQPVPVARTPVRPPADREQAIAVLDWQQLRQSVADCRACGLCRERRQAVLGVGDQQGDWLFIGEGPGADEDARGEPFVGQAGKLLDAMLAAIDLRRGQDVYIANAVKCRPPGNRTPEASEMASCAPYLRRQIELIRPRLIVLLGRAAAHALLGDIGSLASARGRTFAYHPAAQNELSIPVLVTYHPAYLLRTLPDKAKAWEDLCRARALMRVAKASASTPRAD